MGKEKHTRSQTNTTRNRRRIKKDKNEMENLNMAGIVAATSTLIIFFIAATMLIKMLEKNDRKQENL